MRRGVAGALLMLALLAGCGLFRGEPAPIGDRVGATQTGMASWYGPGFHGRQTTSGEVYDQHDLTAAHQTLPLGTRLAVTNLQNGRQVEVRVNDRGPFAKGRIIDLSYAAARELDMVGPGTAPVRVEVLGAPQVTFAPLVYTLQVGSFADQSRALRLKGQLADRFDGVYVAPLPAEAGTYYRVRVGKFSRRDDAARLAETMSDLGLAVIIVEDGQTR